MTWQIVRYTWVPKNLKWHAMEVPATEPAKTVCGIAVSPIPALLSAKADPPAERQCKRCRGIVDWDRQVNRQRNVADQ